MINLVLEDATSFKKCIDAISVLIDEAEFIIDKDALTLKATDPSQISMVDFKLGKGAFKEYKVDSLTKIGLDLTYLAQIMARAKAKDSLEVSLDEEASRLSVVFKGGSTRRFSIPLIDVSAAELPSPKIDFDATLKLRASVLKDGLKDASLISTHITLGVDSQKFYINASSSKGELNNETTKKDKSLVELKVKKEGSSMFPLDYLSEMVKGAETGSDVTLFLKTNAPAKICYNIGKAEITYFLAPRIESE